MGERYEFANGWTMAREDAAPFYWILRDEHGGQVDRDQYRHDVMERHRLKTVAHYGGFYGYSA